MGVIPAVYGGADLGDRWVFSLKKNEWVTDDESGKENYELAVKPDCSISDCLNLDNIIH